MPIKLLLTKAGDIRIADAATGSTLTDGENGPPLVVPAATIKAAAAKMGMAPVAEAPPGTDAWAAQLDADARASFDRCLAAGVDRADASAVASAPAAQRGAFERIAIRDAERARQATAAEASSRESRWAADAKSFLASEPIAKVVTPAASADWEAALVAASRADHASPPAEGQVGAVAAIQSALAKMPPHNFTGATATNRPLPKGAVPLSNDESEAANDKVVTEERRRELLAMTPDGRAILARKARAGANGHA